MVKYLVLAIYLFILGLIGIFVTRKNVIIILMCIELILLASNLNFIVFSIYIDDITGQLFALYVLTVAAAESAIGLAILVVYYRIRGVVSLSYVSLLKG